MTSWQTTDHKTDPLKPSLVERARKRKVEPKSDRNWFRVYGNGDLGDHYETYDVHHRDDGSWHCSCQGNKGGQYRRVCSHITGAVLYLMDHGDDLWTIWDDDEPEQSEVEEPDPTDPSSDADSERQITETGFLDPDDTDITAEDLATYVPSVENVVEDGESDPFEVLDPANPPSPEALGVNPPLPDKFSGFRAAQWKAICEVTEALDDGYKVVMVSAPTGAGKTLIAEAVRRLQDQTQAVYTCTTKTLQDQIMRDFADYAQVLKGRSNYVTLNNPEATCDDCTLERTTVPACVNCPGYSTEGGMSWGDADAGANIEVPHCAWCHPVRACPYTVARDRAATAPLAVLNTAYFLTETNKARGLFADWNLVLIDEADKLEEELMRFVEVTIGPYQRKDLGIGLPKKKTVDEAWVEWIHDEVIPAIEKKIRETPVNRNLQGVPDIKALKKKKRYLQMLNDVQGLITEEEDEETGEVRPVLQQGWVYTGYEGKEDKYVTVTFKPVMVRDYAPKYLWNKGKQFVLLSATLISAEQMAFDLGLEEGEWTVVDVPSSFPPERRPIVVDAEIEVTRKTKDEAYPMLVARMNEIMDAHPGERILVHSVSYDLSKEFYYKLHDRNRLHSYFNSSEREEALGRFLMDPRGVMIAPSFDRGVDLHGDDCRVIVVAKVPYPYLGDAQVKKRTYSTGRSGRIWYAVQTIRTLVQMTGRGMRSEEDWCKTYILDRQFSRLYGENRRLFPSWWADALVWDQNDPRWAKVLAEMEEWAAEIEIPVEARSELDIPY